MRKLLNFNCGDPKLLSQLQRKAQEKIQRDIDTFYQLSARSRRCLDEDQLRITLDKLERLNLVDKLSYFDGVEGIQQEYQLALKQVSAKIPAPGLPDDILSLICRRLSLRGLISFACTSKGMRNAIYGNSLIWKHFWQMLYPTNPQTQLPHAIPVVPQTHSLFKQEMRQQFQENRTMGTYTCTSWPPLPLDGTCFQWHEGRVYLAESDGNICVWEQQKNAGNLMGNKSIRSLIGNGNQIQCLEIHAPFLCSHAKDGVLKIWDLETSGSIFKIENCEKFKIHNGEIYALIFKEQSIESKGRDTFNYTVKERRMIHGWDLATGKKLQRKKFPELIVDFDFYGDHIIAATADKKIKKYSLDRKGNATEVGEIPLSNLSKVSSIDRLKIEEDRLVIVLLGYDNYATLGWYGFVLHLPSATQDFRSRFSSQPQQLLIHENVLYPVLPYEQKVVPHILSSHRHRSSSGFADSVESCSSFNLSQTSQFVVKERIQLLETKCFIYSSLTGHFHVLDWKTPPCASLYLQKDLEKSLEILEEIQKVAGQKREKVEEQKAGYRAISFFLDQLPIEHFQACLKPHLVTDAPLNSLFSTVLERAKVLIHIEQLLHAFYHKDSDLVAALAEQIEGMIGIGFWTCFNEFYHRGPPVGGHLVDPKGNFSDSEGDVKRQIAFLKEVREKLSAAWGGDLAYPTVCAFPTELFAAEQ